MIERRSLGASFHDVLPLSLYYAQRLAAPFARHVGASVIREALRVSHPAPAVTDPEAGRLARELRATGYARLGPVLDGVELREVRAWLAAHPVLNMDDHAETFDPEHPPAHIKIGCYRPADVLACPHLLRLMNAPRLLQAAGAYLGCAPTISAVTLQWSLPCPHGSPAHELQKLHRDPDDWKFFKFFVYLTDVDEGSGPHEVIADTHLERGGFRSVHLADDEARSHYGDALISITGPAGTGFVVDTFGWHRGRLPTRSPRLMLAVQYSLLPVYAFKSAPVARSVLPDHPAPIDAWINRLIVE
jgi:hypothetical protein